MKLFGKPKAHTDTNPGEKAEVAYRLSKVVSRAGAPEPQRPQMPEPNPD